MLGLHVSIVTTTTVLERIKEWSKDKIGRFILVRDVPSLMLSVKDDEFKKIHNEAEFVLPDGMPLVWIGRGLDHTMERVCGPDLMHEICETQRGMGLKHFFYGGKLGVAEKLKKKLQQNVPELQVVGTFCPPFRELSYDEDQKIIQIIIESGADVVWVGVSSPKQDMWMSNHKALLSQTMIGVGAAFDFLSGEVPRAPRWMQHRGLEWVFRLWSEPRRLWRRYLQLAPKFLLAVIKNGLLLAFLKGVVKK